MEEEAPSRRSVAELAGRFKGSSAPPDAAGNEQKTEKPVRRRPPRSLQLSKPHGDEQEQSPDVTSPLPAKAKRNSALIEKLQASLVLSPSALMASPLSPGFRMLPPAFPSPSPSGSAPVSTTASMACVGTPTSPVLTSPPTEEEGPASFETPPIVGEGSILSNDSVKGRARHSIRRRPPSRRHRKSSSDDVAVGNEGQETSVSSPSEAEAKPPRENGQTEEEEREEKEVKEEKEEKEEEKEVKEKEEVKEKKEEKEEKEDEKEVKEEEEEVKEKEEEKEVKEEEKEVKEAEKEEEEEDKTDTEPETRDQDEKKEEEPPEKSPEKQEDDVTQEATNTNEEEKTEETTSPDSVR